MKTLNHYITLLVISFIGFCPQGKAIDALTFQKIDQMMSKYESSDQALANIRMAVALEDHKKLAQFTRNYGAFLRDKIEKNKELTGPELNLIQTSLSSFANLTSLIDYELEKRIRDSEGHRHCAKKLVSWLLKRITTTERFKTIHSLYYNQKMLRRIIQSQMQYDSYEMLILDELTNRILSKRRAQKIITQLSNLHAMTQNSVELRKPLESTMTYQLYRKGQSMRPIYSQDIFWSDTLNSLTTGLGRALSWSFGSSAGNVEWGPGKLYKNKKLIDRIGRDLKPLDLVYEKKTYKLTDYTIPGYWGHVGIWLGTESELKEMGLWEHPALDDFREQIRKGNSIYEVRRWGLNFDNLENFSNLDEIFIARLPKLTSQNIPQVAMIYQNLAKQKDKTYDFTFNALATDRTTCTEIIYLSYGAINWPSKVILGKRTISPNNIAELIFYRNSPVEMIRYIGSDEDGNMIEKDLIDLARTVGYAPKRQPNGQLLFDQIQRKCRRVRRRVSGAIRFRNECENDFVTKKYTPSLPLPSKINF